MMFYLKKLHVRTKLVVALVLLSQLLLYSAVQAQQMQVNIFEVPEKFIAGDDVMVRWNVSGVDELILFHGVSSGRDFPTEQYVVPAEGVMFVPTSPDVGSSSYGHWFELRLTNTEETIAHESRTHYCFYQWFHQRPEVEHHSGIGCPSEPLLSRASQQQFENGFMVWIEELDLIRVFSNDVIPTFDGDRLLFWDIEDTFEQGVDPISDPSITPPPGRLQPEYGFGKVWRENQTIRDNLGWATSAPVNYETVIQEMQTPRELTDQKYTRLSGGVVLFEEFGLWAGDGVAQLGNNNGYAHPTNGIRPPRTTPTPPSGSCVIPTTGKWPPCAYDDDNVTEPPPAGGVPCPESGVWPVGCDPNLPTTPTEPPTTEACVIPPSGPWPPCATGGGGQPTPPPSNDDDNDCVIPPSGPWPPCATTGDTPPANTPDDCVIPPSGPWPPCATGG